MLLLISPPTMAFGQASLSPKNETAVAQLRSSVSISKSSGGTSTRLFAKIESTPVILDAASRGDKAAAQSAAVVAVANLAPSLGISSAASLDPVATTHVANVWHTAFQYSFNGIPIRDCRLHTTIGAITGKLMTATSDIADMEPNTAVASVSSASVLSKLPSYLGDDRYAPASSISTPKLVYVNLPRTQIRLAYEVKVRQSDPDHAWRLTVDAATGRLLEKIDLIQNIGGDKAGAKPQTTIKAKLWCSIHPHSPFDDTILVGLPNTTLIVDGVQVITDDSGYWTTDVLNIYPNVLTGFFNPTYSVTEADQGDKRDTAKLYHLKPNYYLLWNDFDSKPAERDAWYHVNRAKKYMQTLDPGLSNLDDTLIIRVDIAAACNASYDADAVKLNFYQAGGQCSNTGEIADVIYHEFGHRVAAVRYMGGANARQVNMTLAEGFADLCSAFMRDDPRIGIGFFSGDKTQILRSCNNTQFFTGTVNGDPHIAGEIISGAFWDLRKLIGHDTAERLFHEMEWLNPDGPDQTGPDVMRPLFASVLLDVLTVDDDDNNLSNGTPHSDQILQAFAMHGIYLSSFLDLILHKTPDQDSSAKNYPVFVEADYTSPIGTIDLTKFQLHYSIDGGKTYKTQAFNHIPGPNDSLYESDIPKLPPGSVVTYFATASLTIDSGGQTSSPSQSFMVGFGRKYLDDCENDRGWSLNVPTDSAVRGLWIRATPYGTYNIPDHWVQQDTDHTPFGTMCYVTGNSHSREIWDDCVDSGTTTLTTNSIDISEATSPILRYWYFYSNDQMFSDGMPVWVTQISGDGGVNWKELQRTSASTSGWESYWFRVSDYLPSASHVILRFVASNTEQAVVEAGIDDVEVLAAGGTTAVVKTRDPISAHSGIESIYPNPASPSSDLTVQFSVTERARVTLVIKNVLGDVVGRLADETLDAGSYSASCLPSTAHLEPGIYWAVLSTGSTQSIRKLVIQ